MNNGTVKPNVVELHNTLAQGWEQKYTRSRFRRRAVHCLKGIEAIPLSGQLWLDGGCGTGFLSRQLLARGCSVIGVDASTEMLRIAQSQTPEEMESACLYCRVATIECLPLPDASFDGVVCSSVIEYLDRPEACLAELSRVLKPGGILLLSAPNRQSLLRRCLKLAYAVSGVFSANPWPDYMGYSMNEYSRADFIQSLERHGLSVRRVDNYSPFESPFLPARWAGSLLVGMAVKPCLSPTSGQS